MTIWSEGSDEAWGTSHLVSGGQEKETLEDLGNVFWRGQEREIYRGLGREIWLGVV